MAQSNVCRSFDKHTLYQKSHPPRGGFFILNALQLHFHPMYASHSTSLRHLIFVASVLLSICWNSDADAQCEGTELVVHTFTSFANAELAWELADANGSTLSTYAGREMQ